jgi:hypothetical protein
MSFNPYAAAAATVKPSSTLHDSNDTKMSNNEAFLAFLQKNEGSSDDDN